MVIRKLRLDRGWSQEDLAEISGVSVRTVQRIERGGRASLETLKCLAAAFEAEIPDLQKDTAMNSTDQDRDPVELKEPRRASSAPDDSAGWVKLSEEDRAALRYARQLRRYDEWYDDEDGWGEEDGAPGWSGLPPAERAIRKQVRRERRFWANLAAYVAVMALLLAVNLLTSPGYLWVVWPALGWGIGLAFHALDTFGRGRALGDDWERRQVERRLARMARR